MLIENGAPFPVGGRLENENYQVKNLDQKIASFGSSRLMIDFAARKCSFSVLKADP